MFHLELELLHAIFHRHHILPNHNVVSPSVHFDYIDNVKSKDVIHIDLYINIYSMKLIAFYWYV